MEVAKPEEESVVKVELKTDPPVEQRRETIDLTEENTLSSEKSEEQMIKADEHQIGDDLAKKDIQLTASAENQLSFEHPRVDLSQNLTTPSRTYPKSPAQVTSYSSKKPIHGDLLKKLKPVQVSPETTHATRKLHQTIQNLQKEEIEEPASLVAAQKLNIKKGELEPRPPMRDISNLLAIDSKNKSTCVSDFALVLKHTSAQDGGRNDTNGNKEEFKTNSASWREEIISVVQEYLHRNKSSSQHEQLCGAMVKLEQRCNDQQKIVDSRIYAVENDLLQLKSLQGKTESILNEKDLHKNKSSSQHEQLCETIVKLEQRCDDQQKIIDSRISAFENNLLQLKSLQGKTESILNEKISAQQNHVDSFIKRFYDDICALRDQCAGNHNVRTLEERFNLEIERLNQQFASLRSQLNTEKAETMLRVRRLDDQFHQYQNGEGMRFKEEISVLERRVGTQLKDKADYFSNNLKKLEHQFKQIEPYNDGAFKDVNFTLRKLEEKIQESETKSAQMAGEIAEYRRRVQRIVENESPSSLTNLLAELQCQVQPVQDITKKIELLQSEQPKMIKQQVIESIANHISTAALSRLKDMVVQREKDPIFWEFKHILHNFQEDFEEVKQTQAFLKAGMDHLRTDFSALKNEFNLLIDRSYMISDQITRTRQASSDLYARLDIEDDKHQAIAHQVGTLSRDLQNTRVEQDLNKQNLKYLQEKLSIMNNHLQEKMQTWQPTLSSSSLPNPHPKHIHTHQQDDRLRVISNESPPPYEGTFSYDKAQQQQQQPNDGKDQGQHQPLLNKEREVDGANLRLKKQELSDHAHYSLLDPKRPSFSHSVTSDRQGATTKLQSQQLSEGGGGGAVSSKINPPMDQLSSSSVKIKVKTNCAVMAKNDLLYSGGSSQKKKR